MPIPVTTKMINSAVSEDNQFVLKDGRPLHLVKVAGAIVHYHEYWNNDVIGIEDGTGKNRVVLAHCQTPWRNNKWERCDIKHKTKKQDQQIRSIILENSVIPPAHAQQVYFTLSPFSRNLWGTAGYIYSPLVPVSPKNAPLSFFFMFVLSVQ